MFGSSICGTVGCDTLSDCSDMDIDVSVLSIQIPEDEIPLIERNLYSPLQSPKIYIFVSLSAMQFLCWNCL